MEDPITLELMVDPHRTPCGHTFSKVVVADWLKSHPTCPLCSKPCKKGQLKRDREMEQKILAWRKQQKDAEREEHALVKEAARRVDEFPLLPPHSSIAMLPKYVSMQTELGEAITTASVEGDEEELVVLLEVYDGICRIIAEAQDLEEKELSGLRASAKAALMSTMTAPQAEERQEKSEKKEEPEEPAALPQEAMVPLSSLGDQLERAVDKQRPEGDALSVSRKLLLLAKSRERTKARAAVPDSQMASARLIVDALGGAATLDSVLCVLRHHPGTVDEVLCDFLNGIDMAAWRQKDKEATAALLAPQGGLASLPAMSQAEAEERLRAIDREMHALEQKKAEMRLSEELATSIQHHRLKRDLSTERKEMIRHIRRADALPSGTTAVANIGAPPSYDTARALKKAQELAAEVAEEQRKRLTGEGSGDISTESESPGIKETTERDGMRTSGASNLAISSSNVTLETCSLCWDELPVTEMYTVDCAGAHRFCFDCIGRMVDISVKDGARPTCPHEDEEGNRCGYALSEREVQQVCGKGDVWERYKRLLLRIGLQSMQGCVGCPTPGCGNWLVVEAEGQERVRCPCAACGRTFCSRCRGPYHYGPWTCEEVQELATQWASWCLSSARQQRSSQLEEAAFRERRAFIEKTRKNFIADEFWKSTHLRHCPQCNRVIEKMSGCDIMICGRDTHGGNQQHGCGNRFRWRDAKPYKGKVFEEEVALDPCYGEEERLAARGNVRHGEFLRCDSCHKEILGWRFSCIHCPCFNFCEDCEVSSKHDVEHVFRIVREASDPDLVNAAKRLEGKLKTDALEEEFDSTAQRIDSSDTPGGSAFIESLANFLVDDTHNEIFVAVDEPEKEKGVRSQLKRVTRWLKKKKRAPATP